MNLSASLGFIVAFLVIYLGVLHPSPNPKLFLDSHALILVCGGTFAAAMIAFPIKRLVNLFTFLVLGVLFKHPRGDMIVAKEIFLTYHELIARGRFFEMNPHYHPFLVEAAIMMKKAKFKDADLDQVLSDRISYVKKSYIADAKMLNALAKFPPAFGLLGATTGMISMMMGLGGTGGTSAIGPSMAIALVATFWGIAVANLVLLPLSDHATKAAQEEVHTRTMIKNAIVLMQSRASMIQMAENLIGFLPLNSRREFKNFAREVIANIEGQKEVVEAYFGKAS